MIHAEWLGGPWDGRTDVLPHGVDQVSVAMPRKWGHDPFTHEEIPVGNYREVRCRVIRDYRLRDRYLILWHEPQ